MSDMAIYQQLTRLPASSDADNFLFADDPPGRLCPLSGTGAKLNAAREVFYQCATRSRSGRVSFGEYVVQRFRSAASESSPMAVKTTARMAFDHMSCR